MIVGIPIPLSAAWGPPKTFKFVFKYDLQFKQSNRIEI